MEAQAAPNPFLHCRSDPSLPKELGRLEACRVRFAPFSLDPSCECFVRFLEIGRAQSMTDMGAERKVDAVQALGACQPRTENRSYAVNLRITGSI